MIYSVNHYRKLNRFKLEFLCHFSTSSPIWSTSRMFLPQQSFNISKCSASSDGSNPDESQISLGKNEFEKKKNFFFTEKFL
jgi:hypothetical protein